MAIAEFFGIPLDALVKEDAQNSEASLLLALRQMALSCPADQRHVIAAYFRSFSDELEQQA